MARRVSVRVGFGAARPGDKVVELSTMLEAVFEGPEPLLRATAVPALRASLEQRYWVLHDLRELLEQAALEAPMLVCLDDLQWADLGTVAALRSLPAGLFDLPIGWVLAARPPRQAPELARAIRGLVAGGARRLDLEPLDRASVARVTQDAFRAPRPTSSSSSPTRPGVTRSRSPSCSPGCARSSSSTSRANALG